MEHVRIIMFVEHTLVMRSASQRTTNIRCQNHMPTVWIPNIGKLMHSSHDLANFWAYIKIHIFSFFFEL